MFGKLYNTICAQLAKLVNFVWTRDPIANMRYLREGMQKELGRDYDNVASIKAAIIGCDRHIDECAKRVDDDIRMVEAGKRVGDLEKAGLYARRYEEDVRKLEAAKLHKETMLAKYGALLETLDGKKRRLDECGHVIKCREAELHAARIFRKSCEIVVEAGEGAYERFEEVGRNVQEEVDRMEAYCDMARDVRNGCERGAAEVEVERARGQEALERFEKRFHKEVATA